MENSLNRGIPINDDNVTSRIKIINGFRDICKDNVEEANKAMSDLNSMVSAKLLLYGIGVGKLYIIRSPFNYFWGCTLPFMDAIFLMIE